LSSWKPDPANDPAKFVQDGLAEERRPEFHGTGVDSRLLGDDDFMDRCLTDNGGMPPSIRAQQIIDMVCSTYNIDIVTLQTNSQQRVATEARAVSGWLARESGGVTLSEIAKLVNRDIGSISSAARRLADRIQNEPDLASRVQLLKATLLG